MQVYCPRTVHHNWDLPRPHMPSDATALFDIVRGLHYVHFNGLAHRNIHPKTFWFPPLRLLSSSWPILDYASQSTIVDHIPSVKIMEVCATKAPEMLQDDNDREKRGSIAGDTFSAGLVFFFYLSKGYHLFGCNSIHIRINIFNLLNNGGDQREPNNGVNWHSINSIIYFSHD